VAGRPLQDHLADDLLGPIGLRDTGLWVSAGSVARLPASFFPGFWDGTGWGFGVGVDTEGGRAGRYGWSGGLGTNFFVDPDGTVGVLLASRDGRTDADPG
jgi:CubicO group peptidase (beta-lactamase class C family)